MDLNFQKIYKNFEKKLSSNVDYKWRYNLSESRYYTFEELKEKRDEIKFPEDSMAITTPVQRKVHNLIMKSMKEPRTKLILLLLPI